MKKIETEAHYDYIKLFDAVIDKNKLYCETVGQDAAGSLILHTSATYNIGNAYSASDEFYVLTPEEYREYVARAYQNRLISWMAQRRFLRMAASCDTVVSFERVTLHTSGMRGSTEYELVMKDNGAELTEYGMRCSAGGYVREPVRRVVCSEKEALELLNRCRLLSWNGFQGAHPKDVLDGIMFRLEATVNDGVIVKAAGSANFPKHYRELTNGLHELLSRKKS